MKTIQMPVILKDYVSDEIDRLLYACHGVGLGPYLRSLRGQYVLKPREGYTDSFDKIINTVCRFYGFQYYKLKQKGRQRDLVKARQSIYWLGRRYTTLSLQEMGNFFMQDHATVLHAIKNVNDQMETDRMFAAEILQIDDRLNNGFPTYEPIEVRMTELEAAV